MEPDQNGDWRPTASVEVLKLRAELLARIRHFFAQRSVLEVETPALSAAGATDPHLHSFRVESGPTKRYVTQRYLHTSPEFPMKRLLAAGSGSIYQICKVFRDGERGRRHNPEFTMVEWYRVGLDYHAMMDEAAALVGEMLKDSVNLKPTEKLPFRDAFLRAINLDPHLATVDQLIQAAKERGVDVSGLARDDRDSWHDLLLTRLVEPQLGKNHLTCLYDYPAWAAALARIRPGSPPVAERFELYLDGVELANGFQELTDPREQRSRFEQDLYRREQQGLPSLPIDERFVSALAHGLPACSGVALGFDRVVTLAAGANSVDEVLAFPYDRA